MQPQKPTPLPLRPILSVTFNLFVTGLWSSSIYPYLAFMVVDTGQARTLSEAGYFAGVLASSYYAGGVISSMFWGFVSDKIGRRPVMLWSISCAVVLSFLFGLTTKSFWWAVCMRGANGLLNGSIGVGKSVVGELSDSTNQAKAFGWTGAAWGAGTILGASLGGLISRPAESGLVSRDSLFGRYPYLAPNLVASMMYFVGLCFVYWFMPETRSPPTPDEPAAAGAESRISEDGETADEVEPVESPEPIFDDDAGPRSVFHSRAALAAVMTYTILGSVTTCFEEVLPLFMVVPGAGLGFSSFVIGGFNLMMGFFVLIGQLFIWPRVARLAGFHVLYYGGALCYILAFFLVPLSAIIQQWRPLLWPLLVVIAMLVASGDNAAFSSVFCLIANSVPSHLLGATNGLAQTSVAIGRAFAPLLAGNVFAFSMDYHVPWLPWSLLMLGGSAFCLIVFLIPDEAQRPWKERRAERIALRRLRMKLPA